MTTTSSTGVRPGTRHDVRRTWPDRVDAALGLAAPACLGLASLAASGVDLAAVDDRGLAPLLPIGFWLALAGLNAAFVVALLRGGTAWLVGLLVSCLVLLLGGLGALASDVPRNAVAWRHLGIADSMARGTFDPAIDVYFNWPGFFAGLATFLGSTGLSPLAVARVVPTVNMALWALAVVAVLRCLTRDRTLVLLGVWLFLLGNWIDQDYLSPQALGLFWHLVVLALLLSVLGNRVGAASRPAALVDEVPTRAAALGVVLLLTVAVVASHQLTPVVLIVSSAALVLVRASWARWVPVVVGLVLLLWLLYPASTYLAGHPLIGGADPGVLTANLSDRVAGSQGHLEVQAVRIGLTVSLWVLAATGALRAFRAGRNDLRPLVLVVAPFLLLPTDSYGGEMLLRLTLFTLPFVALLAARALVPLLRGDAGVRPRLRSAAGLTLVLTVLAAASVTSRYGNARYDMFSDDEVAAVEQLRSLVAPDTLVVAGAQSTPWASEDYTTYTRRSVRSLCEADARPGPCTRVLVDLVSSEGSAGATLLLTRGNAASLRMDGLMSRQDFARFEEGVRDLPGTSLLYRNDDARIYHLAPTAAGRTP